MTSLPTQTAPCPEDPGDAAPRHHPAFTGADRRRASDLGLRPGAFLGQNNDRTIALHHAIPSWRLSRRATTGGPVARRLLLLELLFGRVGVDDDDDDVGGRVRGVMMLLRATLEREDDGEGRERDGEDGAGGVLDGVVAVEVEDNPELDGIRRDADDGRDERGDAVERAEGAHAEDAREVGEVEGEEEVARAGVREHGEDRDGELVRGEEDDVEDRGERALGEHGARVPRVLEEVRVRGEPQPAEAVDEAGHLGVERVGALVGERRKRLVALEEELVRDGREVELDEEQREREVRRLADELERAELLPQREPVEPLARLVRADGADHGARGRAARRHRAAPPRRRSSGRRRSGVVLSGGGGVFRHRLRRPSCLLFAAAAAANGDTRRRRLPLRGRRRRRSLGRLGVGSPGLREGGVRGEEEGEGAEEVHGDLEGAVRAVGALERELQDGEDERAAREDHREGGRGGVARLREEVLDVEVGDVDGAAAGGEEAPADDEERVGAARGRRLGRADGGEDEEAGGDDAEPGGRRELGAEAVEVVAPEKARADGEREAEGIDERERAAHVRALEPARAEPAVDALLARDELHRGPPEGDAAEEERPREAEDELDDARLEVVETSWAAEPAAPEALEAQSPGRREEDDERERADGGRHESFRRRRRAIDLEVRGVGARVGVGVEREHREDAAVGLLAIRVDRPRPAAAAPFDGAVDIVDDDDARVPRAVIHNDLGAEGHAVPLERLGRLDVPEVDVVEVEDEALRDGMRAARLVVELGARGDVGRGAHGLGGELEDARLGPFLRDEADLQNEQPVVLERRDPDDGRPLERPRVRRLAVQRLDVVSQRLEEPEAVDAARRLDDVVQQDPGRRAVVVRRLRAILVQSVLLSDHKPAARWRKRRALHAAERPRPVALPPVPVVLVFGVVERRRRVERPRARDYRG
mmetsp:Transcript_3002/g.11429  ORF Transcript_3002/g.11429 Transcript_3002/m.11429 type:complete len:936 (+) Transcript_3002:137-2944(+)